MAFANGLSIIGKKLLANGGIHRPLEAITVVHIAKLAVISRNFLGKNVLGDNHTSNHDHI